jgi:hypothetical protein
MRTTALLLIAALGATACSSDDTPAAAADAAPADATPPGTDAAPDAMALPPDAAEPLACDMELPCPAPASGRFMICGRLYDFSSSHPIVDGPTATSLKVSFYDALAFASNPAESTPELSVTPDACGRFVASAPDHQGVSVPNAQFVLVSVDDAAVNAPAGDFVATGVLFEAIAGASQQHAHAYATRETSADDWSGPQSPTLVEQGVYAAIFIDTTKPRAGSFDGEPTAGVTLTRESKTTAKIFYFDDASPVQHSHLGGDATGASGTVIIVGGDSFDTYGGSGPAPECAWPPAVGGTVPNTILVSEREGTCP